ncbi:MAG: cytochrome c [Gemmataceae bacterium]
MSKLTSRRMALLSFGAAFALMNAMTGCQQKMAEQPAPRTYDPLRTRTVTGTSNTEVYTASWSLPPKGTVFRGQMAATDPLVTGLTEKGRKPRKAYPPEYLSKLDAAQAKLLEEATSQPGAPDALDNFVAAFPWKLTEADLKRGQERFTIECAICHGASGNGKGKIAERGTLWPPSYHRDPADKAFDVYGFDKKDKGVDSTKALKQGYSRGFNRFGIDVPLDQVPVGYIFEVISRGYGSMPYLRDKITPEDRWRIAAYIKTLQLSQGASLADLPAQVRKDFENATKPGAVPTPADSKDAHGKADESKKGGH